MLLGVTGNVHSDYAAALPQSSTGTICVNTGGGGGEKDGGEGITAPISLARSLAKFDQHN